MENKKQIYVVKKESQYAVKIQAEGYESAEYIGTHTLIDRLFDISEINRSENVTALFDFR